MNRVLTPVRLAVVVLVALGGAVFAEPLQRLEIQERFGVAHPEQIVYFDLENPVDPSQIAVADEQGRPVACQVMSDGKLAIQADLPANARRAWSVLAKPADTPVTTDLTITERDGLTEIANRLVAVRIPVAPTDPTIATPSPIQGIRLRDGTWSATGPNLMSRPARAMRVEWLERGPLIARVRIIYRYDRAEMKATYEKEVIPAGEGEYACTIEVQAGQPSIRFSERSEVDVEWAVSVDDGLSPDRAQYRGFCSNDPVDGHNPDGTPYGMEKTGAGWVPRGARGPDALVDLDFTSGRVNGMEGQRYRFMAQWDPWANATGSYWQLYSSADRTPNLLGIFTGPASTLGGIGVSGVGIDAFPAGVLDLDSELDRDGRLHAVYQHDDELRYVCFDATLSGASAIIPAGKKLARPALAMSADGTVWIAATDALERTVSLLRKSAGANAFITETIELEGGMPKLVSVEPHLASAGDQLFLMLCDTRVDAVEPSVLYTRLPETARFSRVGTIPPTRPASHRQMGNSLSHMVRPVMHGLPSGELVVMFNDGDDDSLRRAVVPAGEAVLPTPAWICPQNRGIAIDALSGEWASTLANSLLATGRENREFTSESQLGALDPGHPAANRRTFAVDPQTRTALFVQMSTPYKSWPTHREPRPSFLARRGGNWEHFTAANDLGLAWARAHFHALSGQFLILGRNGTGQLALYAWKPDEPSPRLLHELSGSAANGTAIRVGFQRVMPTGFYARDIRFDWRLFSGTKSEDLQPVDQIQGIGRQMNLHSGVNLNALCHASGDIPPPPRGYGSQYAPAAVWNGYAQKLRDEKSAGKDELYQQLVAFDPSGRSLIDLWRNNDAASANAIADQIVSEARDLVEHLVNGKGVLRHERVYFMGANVWNALLLDADQVLASGLLDAQKQHDVTLALELFGRILWDDDFVPTQPGAGINLGPANMISMWRGARHAYTIFLAADPFFASRAKDVAELTIRQLADYVDERGVPDSSAGYLPASLTPVLNLCQQLQMAGISDPFRTEERLAGLGEFLLQQVTPRDPRFGGLRKMVCIGDGSTTTVSLHAQLATGLVGSRSDLSRRLMGAWDAMGRPHNGFTGSSFVRIDPDLSATSPALGDAQFLGWCSVLRTAFDTPDETALWFVNGDRYADHRHNDQGNLVLYALGAPLSLDWGSIYYPRVAGGLMHSLVVPEALLKQPWDSDNTPVDDPPVGGTTPTWSRTRHEPMRSFTDSASVAASFGLSGRPDDDPLRWRRCVRMLRHDPTRPVIVIEDEFPHGTDKPKQLPMVWTFNSMSEGPVTTPAGTVEPPRRRYDWRDPAQQQLPSALPGVALPVGLNRFGFSGQWLIDWDLYIDVSAAGATTHSSLGHWSHPWHPTPDISDFRKAQNREFEESQQILRLRGADGFRVLVLPRRKSDPRRLTPTSTADGAYVIEGDDYQLTLSRTQAAFRSKSLVSLTTFTGAPANADDIRIAGGPAEVRFVGDSGSIQAIATADGENPARQITLPSGWQAKTDGVEGAVVRQDGANITIQPTQRGSIHIPLGKHQP
jgi:hypothetical protein